jgi:hypothetical protein
MDLKKVIARLKKELQITKMIKISKPSGNENKNTAGNASESCLKLTMRCFRNEQIRVDESGGTQSQLC